MSEPIESNHWVNLVDEPISLLEWQAALEDPDVGAHGWFLGVTRRTTEDRITETLSYQAHRTMALKELEKLAVEAIKKFSLVRLVIVHRLGEVPVGEASVVVGCSSAHRVDTFDALRWIMEVLKRDVPIWKQETYAGGSTQWVHPETDRKA
ncbi:MAG: molybdenum cofactor biosynthesis protein MoaE [Pirellulales bacterium]|nr:molybdenum cofactor biosynthesis protein MoaE [Pirellulales bacterium]